MSHARWREGIGYRTRSLEIWDRGLPRDEAVPLTDPSANARVNGHANRHRLDVSRQKQHQRIGAYPPFVKRLHRIVVGATLDEQLTLDTQLRSEGAPLCGGVPDADSCVRRETLLGEFHAQTRAFDAAKGNVRRDLRMFVDVDGAGLEP